MTYKVELPKLFKDRPIWWQDAIRKHGINWIEDNCNGLIRNVGRYTRVDSIVFESEAHFTFFLLSI
jgi:hypothetical protein